MDTGTSEVPGAHARQGNPHLWLALAASAVLAGLSLIFAKPGSTYRFAFVFLVPLVWILYGLRRKLQLHPLHYAFFLIGILLHDLGMFGYYRRSFFRVEFDVYVHSYFGFAAAFMFYRSFQRNFHFRGLLLWSAVIITILGFGAIHELIEYGSTMILGPEKGMLKNIKEDPYDTQEDLLNNFLGATTALICYGIYHLSRGRANSVNQGQRAPASVR